MRRGASFATVVLVLLFLGVSDVARGDDGAATKVLRDIRPPGGAPLRIEKPGKRGIDTALMDRVRTRLAAAPEESLDRWIVELERIMDAKLEGDLARQACRTYFVMRMSVAFDDLKWNAEASDRLLKRAHTMPAFEARAWKTAFESVLKKEIGQTATEFADGGPAYAVPLVLVPVDALHDGPRYSIPRGKKYRARLEQLTAEDVALWKDRVDKFGGTALDAAVNIILLDGFFESEKFQRPKFRAAIAAGKLDR